MGSGVSEKCGRRLELPGAEGKRWGLEAEKVGPRWGLSTDKLPSFQASEPRCVDQAQGREGAHREGGRPFPAQAALIPTAGSLERIAGVGAETGGCPSPSNSRPTPALGGEAGGMTRGLGTGGWGEDENGASGGSSSLFKVCGRQKSRLCAPQCRRLASASPSSPARPTATSLSAPAPRGSRIPSPASIPPCARAPPAPSLRAGSPARREQKVNEQPQPQRQITMRKINQEIAVRVSLPAAAPLSTGRGGSAGRPGRCV